MEIIRSLESLESGPPSVVTVGVFDGVHLGHQTIMRIVKAGAVERNVRAVAITFDRLPEEMTHPESTTRYITTLDQKLDLIAEQGIDLAAVMPLEKKLLDMRARRFVKDILHSKLSTVQLVVGTSFAFGKGREGNLDLLRNMGRGLGFEVVGVSPIKLDNFLVSSTVIRRLIAKGEVERANELLGRCFTLEGEVVPGEGIGQILGFPTANLRLGERQIVPAKGVYAAVTYLDGERWAGAMNIGSRPTVSGKGLLVEVHVIGFSGNLYGRKLRVEFHHRLRDEMRFPGIEALKKQIRADVERIEAMLGQ